MLYRLQRETRRRILRSPRTRIMECSLGTRPRFIHMVLGFISRTDGSAAMSCMLKTMGRWSESELSKDEVGVVPQGSAMPCVVVLNGVATHLSVDGFSPALRKICVPPWMNGRRSVSCSVIHRARSVQVILSVFLW